MSFSKRLKCGVCSLKLSLQEENFPEDLHDQLVKYAQPRLYWICRSCDKLYCNTSEEIFSLKDEIKLLKSRVDSLECDIKKLTNPTRPKRLGGESEYEGVHTSFDLVAPETFMDSGYQDSQSECFSSLVLPDYESAESSPRSRSSTPHSISRNLHSDDGLSKKSNALQILDKILKTKIKIDPKESAKSANIVTTFLNDITPALKKDTLFRSMYERDYKTGSSYNELRISSASEYDIEVVFKAPPHIQFEVEFFQTSLTVAKLKWKKTGDIPESKKDILHFLEKNSENGCLKPMKISNWFHGLIDVYMNSNPKIDGIKKMRNSKSGPARTIEIETDEGYKLSIDLLPAFVFAYAPLKGTKIETVLKKYPVQKQKEFWFLVPKQCKGEVDIKASEVEFAWRVDFPQVEKKVLYNKSCAKNVVKLLKLFRDIEKWDIASYFLKTIILWAIDKNDKSEHWQNGSLFDRYLEALTSLQTCMENRKMPYFMDDSYNLLHEMNEGECKKLSNRLKKIINDIKLDNNNLNIIYS